MGKPLKSKVVKVDKVGRNTREDNEMEIGRNQSDLIDRGDGKSSRMRSRFVDKDSNLTTEVNLNDNSSYRQTRTSIDYTVLSKSGKKVPANKKQLNIIKFDKINKSLKSQWQKPKDKKVNKSTKGTAVLGSTDNNEFVNLANSNPLDDGVLVTVHAPDDEFAEMSDGSDSFDIDEDEPGRDVRVIQTNTSKQGAEADQQQAPEQESAEQIMRKYKNNPYFKDMVQDMVRESILSGSFREEFPTNPNTCAQSCTQQEAAVNTPTRRGTTPRNTLEAASPQRAQKRQRTGNETLEEMGDNLVLNVNSMGKDMQQTTPSREKTQIDNSNINKLKSPSDTTIYAPGLQKVNYGKKQRNQMMLNKISNFVETVRNEVDMQQPQPSTSGRQQPQPSTSRQPQQMETQAPTSYQIEGNEEMDPQVQMAREYADKLILDAERYKASLAAPRGNYTGNDILVSEFPRTECNPSMDNDNDDDFFHLTCHIEPSLRANIEKGEFVDLEKLLPKTKFPHRMGDDNRMEMVNHDGVTYFVPATDKDSSINGIKKWDQAFRVYAAIYCKSNPARSAEIWQYIYTIHTAAGAFQWDNVAWYDYTFRQLMAVKPHRSWAKTYTQFWNLAMRNPIGVVGQTHVGNNGFNASGDNNSNKNKKYRDWRDKCCWVFNRIGRCTRATCNFENRCNYCGGYNHGRNTCRKAVSKKSPKLQNQQNGGNGNGNNNNQQEK